MELGIAGTLKLRGCALSPSSHSLLLLTLPVSVQRPEFRRHRHPRRGHGRRVRRRRRRCQRGVLEPGRHRHGATFDLQVSKAARIDRVFVGVATSRPRLELLPDTRSVDRFTYSFGLAGPTKRRIGRGAVRTLTTTNFGVTVVQTVVPGLVIGTTARAGSRRHRDIRTARTTVDLDAGAMVSAWDLRFGLTAETHGSRSSRPSAGMVRMKRQFTSGRGARPRSLPTGVHGPFTLAFDADLTTTPDCREATGGRRRRAESIGWRRGLSACARACGGAHLAIRAGRSRAGLRCRLPRSLHVEGQMTKAERIGSRTDGIVGARVTF